MQKKIEIKNNILATRNKKDIKGEMVECGGIGIAYS